MKDGTFQAWYRMVAGPAAQWILVCLVVMVTSMTVLSWFGRKYWAADLLSHVTAHYALLTIVAGLSLLWCRRPRWATLSVLVGLWHLLHWMPFAFPSGETAAISAVGPAFSVFQFNVGEQEATRHSVVEWVTERASEIDVVVLLEVDDGWGRALLRLGELFDVSASELRNDPFGVAILTRLPGASARIERIGPLSIPSAVVTVAAQDGWPPVTLVGTHPPAPVSAWPWRARNQQVTALADYAGDLDGEVVIVGDLNTTKWSPWYRDLERRSDLRDAWAHWTPWPTWAPYWMPMFFGLPIDQLLVTSGLAANHREYLPRMASDHRPIVTRIVLRRQ